MLTVTMAGLCISSNVLESKRYKLDSLKEITFTGSRIQVPMVEKFKKNLPGTSMVNRYGIIDFFGAKNEFSGKYSKSMNF